MKSITFFISIFLAAVTAFAQPNSDKATSFLNSLSWDQKSRINYPLDDNGRDDWHYFPPSMFTRPGIALKELNTDQLALFHTMLKEYMSTDGYEKSMQIIRLENILGEITNNPSYRDSGNYFVAFYGKATDTAWGWRFEGHHLSMHFTIADKQFSTSPRFYGANPAVVKSGKNKGLRVLKNEEDLGFKMINALNEAQKKKAIYQSTTYGDIVSGNSAKVDPLAPVGIAMKELTSSQQAQLLQLIHEYFLSDPEALATTKKAMVASEKNQIYFGWAGKTESGKPHYYRIQGKSFLIEFDNAQSQANHIHCVWRDFDGDFGRDILKEHYQTSHN